MDQQTYIKGHEDCRLKKYYDKLGFPTIGWGHLCVKNEYEEITQQQADEIFEKSDFPEALNTAKIVFPNFDSYSPNRQMALVDMCYQMGFKLFHFPKALQHVSKGEWNLAVADFLSGKDEFHKSLWAIQTPGRAIDNAILLLQG